MQVEGDFVFKMMNFVFKMMNFALNMMNFAGEAGEAWHGGAGELFEHKRQEVELGGGEAAGAEHRAGPERERRADGRGWAERAAAAAA